MQKIRVLETINHFDDITMIDTGQIGDDQHAAGLVATGDQLGEQIHGDRLEWQIA